MTDILQQAKRLVDLNPWTEDEYGKSRPLGDCGAFDTFARGHASEVAKVLLGAVEVLKKIAYTHPYDKSYILGSKVADGFLQRIGVSE